MSLYGALFSGVSGLTAQANRIGTVSDNISNVNTVGYKSTEGLFETLVTNSGTIAYSPGGVLGRSRSSVGLQGLLQTTNSNTDVAISGNGFYVVNGNADSTGTTSYTRAGSFRQDATGNFINAAGYFLQGWPLDRNGRLPGEPGNANTTSSSSLESVETVNVSSFTGSAAATTSIELSANLQASKTQFPGASGVVDMDANSTDNYQITSSEVIVPGTVNGLTRGDRFVIESGLGLSRDVRYGGFTFSKEITTGGAGDDGVVLPTSPLTLGNNPISTTLGDQTVNIRHGNHGLTSGEVVTLSGVAAPIGGVPASDLNQTFVVTVVDEDNYTIEVSTTATSTVTAGGGTSVQSDFRDYIGNVLDASTASATFLGTTGTSVFSATALSFTIATPSVGTSTFTYTSGTPNSQLGQFNTLNNLATAISAVDGLTARVVDNQLYVSSIDATESISFANGNNVATGSGSTLARGIDWVAELGFANVATGANRFSTLAGLAAVVNAEDGFSATITNPDSAATISINVDDPLDTITIRDVAVSAATTTFTSGDTLGTDLTNPSRITVNFASAHGYSANDVITFDPTSMSNYPVAVTGVGAFATTATNATVVVTQTAHGFTNGDAIAFDVTSIAGYPNGNIGGIPLYEFQDLLTVANVTANTYEITLSSPATATGTDGAVTGTFLASPTISGIPLTDFNRSFEIGTVTSNSFTINVKSAATATATNAATGLIAADPTNGGSVVAELGLVASLDSSAFTAAQTTGVLGPSYAATDADKNMASGSATPQYFTNIRVFDSLGTGHDIRAGFIKTGTNTWAVEVFAVDSTEVSDSFANGQLASGTIRFNGDGSLLTVDSGLSAAIPIVWENGATASSITIDWGTAGSIGTGDTDGLTQFDSDDNLNFANQNGVPVGELIGVQIDSDGIVTATFSNGEQQNLYKIPLADFSNPDGLNSTTGNVFSESRESGTVNLREPGSSGVGTLQSSALESSNVELSEQLTGMIVAQRAYQANTKTITTTDRILEELNNILR